MCLHSNYIVNIESFYFHRFFFSNMFCKLLNASFTSSQKSSIIHYVYQIYILHNSDLWAHSYHSLSIFLQLYFFNVVSTPMWGSNSQPQNQESVLYQLSQPGSPWTHSYHCFKQSKKTAKMSNRRKHEVLHGNNASKFALFKHTRLI